jgi:hypothetical protein
MERMVIDLFNNEGLYKERHREVFILSSRMFNAMEHVSGNMNALSRNFYTMIEKLFNIIVKQNKQLNYNLKFEYMKIIQIKKFFKHSDKRTVNFVNYVSQFVTNTKEYFETNQLKHAITIVNLNEIRALQ